MGKHVLTFCHVCDRRRPAFTVRLSGCDKCRPETNRKASPDIVTWADIRGERDRLLREADGKKGKNISAYKQALRDIPQTFNLTSSVIWPKKPFS